jgi:hypothetical protein
MTEFETLRQQADDAARNAYRLWEQCKGSEIIAIAYPWFVRPARLPLNRFEVDLAFKLGGGDFETAALMLRVSTERLQRAVIGTKHNRKRKEAPDVDSPVRWQEKPGRRIITIRRIPGDGQDNVSADFNIAGDLVVTIQRDTANS